MSRSTWKFGNIFLDFRLSQGSVATYCRWVGKLCDAQTQIIFLRITRWKKNLKISTYLPKILSSGLLFGDTVYISNFYVFVPSLPRLSLRWVKSLYTQHRERRCAREVTDIFFLRRTDAVETYALRRRVFNIWFVEETSAARLNVELSRVFRSVVLQSLMASFALTPSCRFSVVVTCWTWST